VTRSRAGLHRGGARGHCSGVYENAAKESGRGLAQWKWEALGLAVLALMAVYFLKISWRKWPDPIIDAGPQWYATWRVSQGGLPYHDFLWNYGPLSVCLNACLFKIFGPGMMVLAMANLAVYGVIAGLAYAAFRMAWGAAGAFAAMAVFISVFSFSHLTSVGNYNFVTPYAPESTHGMVLMLGMVLVAVRWLRGASGTLAFLAGLCGGLTVVLKPEFMLAWAVLAGAVWLLRLVQRRSLKLGEYGLVLCSLVLPTLAFTLSFARVESWKASFIDASQAWWLVLVDKIQWQMGQQLAYLGLDHPWENARLQLEASAAAVLILAALWAAGWCLNRSWSRAIRLATALGALALAWLISSKGGPRPPSWLGWTNALTWFYVGRCFPVLTVLVLALVVVRVWREARQRGRVEQSTAMALMLVLMAGIMLLRMPLRARIYHLGFYQGALAAMVGAAVMVVELPRWTGAALWGKRLAAVACVVLLALGCKSVAAKSRGIFAEQVVPVGAGRDRFYAFNGAVDETGMTVNFILESLRSAPPRATVVALPAGGMINYLSRHIDPLPAMAQVGGEAQLLENLQRTRPDYVILICRDPRQYGPTPLWAQGHSGRAIVDWLAQNYVVDAAGGGDPLDPDQRRAGTTIARRK
jgi:hypothetical protein